MAVGLFWASVLLSIFFVILALDIMGFFSKKNYFQVDGRVCFYRTSRQAFS